MAEREDLRGRLPIVYNGKSVEEWYSLYCQEVMKRPRVSVTKRQVDTLANFVSVTPPVNHNRKTYNTPCSVNCRACEYLKLQEKAVDVLCKLRIELEDEENDN